MTSPAASPSRDAMSPPPALAQASRKRRAAAKVLTHKPSPATKQRRESASVNISDVHLVAQSANSANEITENCSLRAKRRRSDSEESEESGGRLETNQLLRELRSELRTGNSLRREQNALLRDIVRNTQTCHRCDAQSAPQEWERASESPYPAHSGDQDFEVCTSDVKVEPEDTPDIFVQDGLSCKLK